MTGRFIVLEGGEGVGKSTQAGLLDERLRAAGYDVVKTREPGGTEKGIELRHRLLHDARGVDPQTELALMLEDRTEHVELRIRPAVAAGKIVVCERFSPSTLAYQGVGRGLGVAEVERRAREATGGFEPDLVIVLDMADDDAEARITGWRDRFEREGAEFHACVRAAYRDLAPERGWLVVDASGDRQEVADRVWAVVQDRI